MQNEKGTGINQFTKQQIWEYLQSSDRADKFADVQFDSYETFESTIQELEKMNKILVDREILVLI